MCTHFTVCISWISLSGPGWCLTNIVSTKRNTWKIKELFVPEPTNIIAVYTTNYLTSPVVWTMRHVVPLQTTPLPHMGCGMWRHSSPGWTTVSRLSAQLKRWDTVHPNVWRERVRLVDNLCLVNAHLKLQMSTHIYSTCMYL